MFAVFGHIVRLNNARVTDSRKMRPWIIAAGAQFGTVVIESPVNFESVIITGRYCTISGLSIAAFPGAHSELPCKLYSIIWKQPWILPHHEIWDDGSTEVAVLKDYELQYIQLMARALPSSSFSSHISWQGCFKLYYRGYMANQNGHLEMQLYLNHL